MAKQEDPKGKPINSSDRSKPTIVKAIDKGFVFSHKNELGNDVFKRESDTPKQEFPVKPIPGKPGVIGVPKKRIQPKPRDLPPTDNVEYQTMVSNEPDEPVTQKRQYLRSDGKQIFPDGMLPGYTSHMFPDLENGGNFAKAKNVIVDKDGMPVSYDFKTNKYNQTGEPSIYKTMPVQNDTPTIQAPLQKNELDTKFGNVPTRLNTPQYNASPLKDAVTDPNSPVDYKGFNQLDTTPDNKSNLQFLEEQKKNNGLVKPPHLKKGGVVGQVKGYFAGGTTYDPNMNIDGSSNTSVQQSATDGNVNAGVVGMNDQYTEEQKKRNAAVRKGVGSALGGIGSAYFSTTPTATKDEATYNAVGSAVSQMGPVGGVVGGIIGIANKFAKPIKASSESMDSQGNLKNSDRASRNAIVGGIFDGGKALQVRGSYAGGYTDLTGKGYTKHLEDVAKGHINEVKAANVASQQQQAIAARDAGNFNPTITKPYDLSGATFDENQNLVLSGGQQFDKNRPMKKGGVVQMCADGGVIRGKGGPKDDKINAKVEGGSFVVPAENAKLAEELRAKLLKSPPKTKANLKQGGGEKVRLSNGEHLFTPEEKEELLERGVDVNLLAPHADVKEEKKEMMSFPNVTGYALGGTTDENPDDTVDPKKELARIEAENKKAAEDKVKAENNATENEKVYQLKRRRDSQIKEHRDNIPKYTKLVSDTEKEYTDFQNSRANSDKLGYKSKNDETAKGLLATLQDYKNKQINASRTYKFVSDNNNYNNDGSVKEVKNTQNDLSKVEASNDLEFKPRSKQSDKTYEELITKPNHFKGTDAEWKKAADASIAKGDVIPKVGSTKIATGVKAPSMKGYTSKYVAPQVVDNGAADEAVVPSVQKTDNNFANVTQTPEEAMREKQQTSLAKIKDSDLVGTTPTKRRGIGSMFNNVDPTAFLGIGQTALGLNYLGKDKRPIDKSAINSTYDANVNRAQAEAQYGFTAENKSLLDQQQANMLNDARMSARTNSGGNAGNAFNMERSAINQGWTNALQLRSADQDLRMEKARYADQQVKERANFLDTQRRRAYGDAMDAFQQKQQAGSELIGAGIRNTIGAYRYGKELNAQEDAEKQANAYKNTIG